jgi:ATP adenylyltransferase
LSYEQLWAPWRLDYIVQPKESPREAAEADAPAGCFLCRYRDAGPSADAENYVLARSGQSIVVLNRFPYNNGHLLIAPLAHKAGLSDLSDDELCDGIRQVTRLTESLQKLMRPDGFNVGLNLGRAAGAGLPGHLHWHIVPRWVGDTNFMPVVGNAHVIPQSLRALYDFLRPMLD